MEKQTPTTLKVIFFDLKVISNYSKGIFNYLKIKIHVFLISHYQLVMDVFFIQLDRKTILHGITDFLNKKINST